MISRLARHTTLRLALFFVLAAVLVWPVLGEAARLNEFRDVHHLFLYERSAIDTIRRYGQLPLWNPYYCGGFDAVAAPQTRFTSPTLLLGLLFVAERAEILTVFFFAVVGMEGMYRWLRLRVNEPLAALLVAPVFALSGQYAVAYHRGWIQFMGFEWHRCVASTRQNTSSWVPMRRRSPSLSSTGSFTAEPLTFTPLRLLRS